MKLVFYPWPGCKPLEQERDPCSVQRKLWECPFGAGKDHNWNSDFLGRDFLSTASSEVVWRFLCALGSAVLVTQGWVMPCESPVLLELEHTRQDTQGWAPGPSATPASDSFLLFVASPCPREG